MKNIWKPCIYKHVYCQTLLTGDLYICWVIKGIFVGVLIFLFGDRVFIRFLFSLYTSSCFVVLLLSFWGCHSRCFLCTYQDCTCLHRYFFWPSSIHVHVSHTGVNVYFSVNCTFCPCFGSVIQLRCYPYTLIMF